jgi:putative effector of murein hydrolase LrgA (UPF0299 family)
MDHAKTSIGTEMFVGAIISVVQYLAPLRDSIFQVKTSSTYCTIVQYLVLLWYATHLFLCLQMAVQEKRHYCPYYIQAPGQFFCC